MENISELVLNSLLIGAVLSLALVIIMTASACINPAIWADDYPPDVKARFGPLDERTQRQKRWMVIPFFGVVLAALIYGIARQASLDGEVRFMPAFLTSFLILFTFNVFDLLILDWLLFNTVTPKIMILPGTEGMAGYKDYMFHFIGFLKGIVFCLVTALLFAGLAWVIGQVL